MILIPANDARIMEKVLKRKEEERLFGYCWKMSEKSLNGNTNNQSHRIPINVESRELNIRLDIS